MTKQEARAIRKAERKARREANEKLWDENPEEFKKALNKKMPTVTIKINK